jgi:tripartite-type tricarboxylate transporter receptor subunit TctC
VKQSIRLAACLAAALATTTLPATAQSWPNKPIRMLVGFAPGGFTDIAGRMAAQGLADALGQQVLVENRAGSNGAIAAEATARAAPDGYTIYMASPGHTTNPILQAAVKVHPIRDFTALSGFADIPNVLVVHGALPAQNVKEFLALARSRPTPLTQATTGVGAPGHLIGELLQLLAKVTFTHVPYKGSGPIMPDLISGQVDFSFPSAASALSTVQSGRIRALGVASPKRSKAYPDVPTISEAGVPGFEVMGWYGVFGPARLPREVTTRLSTELVRVANRPDIQTRLGQAGAEPIASNAEDFAVFVAADYDKWLKVIKAANIKAE